MAAKKILIVEDEEKFRFSLGLVLRQQGYAVSEAGHGIEALAALDEATQNDRGFDLVITDIKMPQMNGLELIGSMKNRRIATPVIVMTGYNHSEFRTPLRDMGCRKVIDKPFEAEELLREVAAVFAERQIPG